MFPTSLVPTAAYQHPLLEGPRFYVVSKEPRAKRFHWFRQTGASHNVIAEISLRLHDSLRAPSTRASVVNR